MPRVRLICSHTEQGNHCFRLSGTWAILVLLICPSLLTAKGDPVVYLHFGVLSYHFGLCFKLATF